jgi:flagellar biosynthesis protein FlhF
VKIKRYFAKDMRLALQQVKEELGADAVIMSNKKVAGGVEIVAAVDNDVVERQMSSPTGQAAQQSRYNIATANNYYDRSLKQDTVSIGQGRPSAQDELSNGEVSRQFANMLQRYQESESQPKAKEPDSLSKLLQRQAKAKHAASQGYREQSAPQRGAQKALQRHPVGRQSLAEESGLSRLISDDSSVRPKAPRLDPTRYDKNQPPAQPAANQEMESIREEMSSIRRLLEHQVSGLMWQEVERREPLRAMLIKRLERMGLAPDLADQLACYIPEDTEPKQAWQALLELLADQITINKTDLIKKGGVVALLGPTGVGKTTTVAKLAARAAMEYGPDEVALVTTDTYRIGAHEQLSIYGRIMGSAVRVAKDSEELADILYQLRDRRLILVDTAGMGQRDVRLSEQLDTLMQESGEVIHSYLVLPATAQRQVLQETLDHFRRIPLSGCILTKLDESLSLGEFINVAVHNALPVSYVANGQRVPEDLVLAQARYLVAKASELLEKSTQDEPHFWTSDMDEY